MIRSVDLWDLTMPVGVTVTREKPAVRTRPEHRVLQARSLDRRPQRAWRWQRDGATAFELLRFRELCDSTAGAMPVDLWLPRRNGLIFTGDIARGFANRSAYYGWATPAEADIAVASDAQPTPAGGAAAALNGTSSGTEGVLFQEVGRVPRREQRWLTFSLHAFQVDAPEFGLQLFDVEDALEVEASFEWSGSDLVVQAVDVSVNAEVEDAGGGWWRASMAVMLEQATNLQPNHTLAVRVLPTLHDGGAATGHLFWGAQLVLGAASLGYQDVGPDRVQPVPVVIQEERFERQTGVANRISARLVEFID